MMMGGREQMFQRETSKPQDVGATLARFWQYFNQFKLALFSVAILIVVGTYMQVLVPDLIGQAVDCYITTATRQAFSDANNIPAPITRGTATNCWYTIVNPQATTSDFIAGLGGLVLIVVAGWLPFAIETRRPLTS